MRERLLRGDGLERSRREDFDPIAEGQRYGLAPEVSKTIWERARREATNRHGVCDEDLARECFVRLATRVAQHGAQLGAVPFHRTQFDAATSAAPRGNVLANPVPGRTTLVLARASGRASIGLDRDPGRTTLLSGYGVADVCTPEDSRGFFQQYVTGGHAARTKLERALASSDNYAAVAATAALKQELAWARHHLANGLAHDGSLRAKLAALEGPAEELLASATNMDSGVHRWQLWTPHVADSRTGSVSERSGTGALLAATDSSRDERTRSERSVRTSANGERRAIRRNRYAPASERGWWQSAAPRVASAAPIARLATGTVAITSERALELAASSTGRPLSLAMQQRFAYLFDHGFDHVQLHTDAAARQACEALAARGFTIGSHVYVGLDEQQLETPAGGELLQHELAHVVQHDRGQLASGPARVTEPGDWVERAAHQLVEATQPRRERLEAGEHAPAPRSRSTALFASEAPPIGPWVIARDALGTLHGTDLAVSIEEPGLSVHVLLILTAQQAQRFQADPNLATRLAQDFAHTLSPGGQPRFEGRAFLESSAVTSRLTHDVGAWLEGRGLPQTTGFLDQRAQALGRLNLLAPLERTLATRGILAGSIDWAAVGPTLLAEQPQPARTLIEASVQDRYHLFLRAIMTEAASRPAVRSGHDCRAACADTARLRRPPRLQRIRRWSIGLQRGVPRALDGRGWQPALHAGWVRR